MNIMPVLLKMLKSKARAFEEATKDPIAHQKSVLFEYLNRNKRTEYGRKYNFSGIRSIEEFRSRVPIIDYEDLRPLIARMAKGEKDILTADRAIFFGITSGTTGEPKLIPVTKYSRKKKTELMKLWTYYVYRDHPHVFKGKVLAIISPEIKNCTESGIPYGPEDGHAYNNLPAVVRHLYVLPYQIFYIKDYDARYYCMLRISMEQNVTTIATLNPSTMVLLCRQIEKVQNDIIKDIEEGTLKKGLDIPCDIRKLVEKNLRPNPKRATELKKILKEGKPLYPKYFWPDLELMECWKGGTVKLYLKELPQYLGDVPFRDFGCLSTESRSAIPMTDEGAGSVLAVKTNFYEFVPREEMGKIGMRTLLCDELEKGKEYYLIVTTAGGLYRYSMDDVITVDGFFNKTPVIEFIQKGKNAISITGEKIYESHINEAVNKAADKHHILIGFFSAFVELGAPARYIFLAEFNGTPSSAEKKALLRTIEEELCNQNSEYKDIREQVLLGHPVLRVVKSGEFEKYRARKIAEGRHEGQFKVPELVGDRNFHKNFCIEEEITHNLE